FTRKFCGHKAEGMALLRKGLLRMTAGAVLLLSARLLWEAIHSRVLATIPLLIGISLLLHFGLFNVLAGIWRILGVRTYTLFPAPLISKTLTEFWGKRWNLPFTEMGQRALYRPLSPVWGRHYAALMVFVFSGLVHEVAISVPVMAGFGLPMLYF